MALTTFPSDGIQLTPTNSDQQQYLIDFSDSQDVTFAFQQITTGGGTVGRPTSGVVWPRRQC
jgi:uncharacterized glyoxalase superfamily protein PhnB